MKPKEILFFADRLPPLVGGMEIHGGEFIRYFKDHPKFPLATVITQEKAPIPTNINPSILFFNSGRWIEGLKNLRARFPRALFIYRTGGNEILKAPLTHQVIPSHVERQSYWVKTLNKSLDLLITNSSHTEKRLRDLGITIPFAKCVGGATLSYPLKKKKGKTLTFFCAARFVPYKNHLLLIRVFKALRKRGHLISLRLAGEGPLLQKAQIEGGEDPAIKFLGAIDNQAVSQEMRRADLYIQFSTDYKTNVPGGTYLHCEGMGRSILEAISTGTYIIAGRSGALDEVITKDRGTLIDLQTVEAVTHTLEKIILSPIPNLLPVDTFSWSNLFNQYETLYESPTYYRKM